MYCVFDGGLSVQEYTVPQASSLPSPATLTTEFIRGEGMGGGVGGMVYSIADGNIKCSHANHRGDVIARSDNTGSLTSFALYEAYGTRPYEWPADGSGDPDRQKANTKEEETDLGLLNEGMRFRDLETGTFLTRDPIGYADGPNVYCYVHCNPITKFDALGLWKSDVHRDDTKKWAKEAGFSDKQAETIAKASNGVDSILKGKSFLPIIGRQSYHFNTNKEGEKDSRVKHAEKHFNKAVKLWKKAEKQETKGMTKSAAKTREKALKQLGKALHPLQDTKAHDKANTKKFLFVYYHKEKMKDGTGVDDAKERPKEHKETGDLTKNLLDDFLVETGQKDEGTQGSSGGGDDRSAQPETTTPAQPVTSEPEDSAGE